MTFGGRAWVGLTLVCIALVVGGCESDSRSQTSPSGPDGRFEVREGAPSPQKVEQFAEVRLPAATQELEVWGRRSVDTSVSFRLPMSRSDFEAFYESGAFTQELVKGKRPSISEEGHFDWPLESVREPWGHEELVKGFSRRVLVDFDDPDRPVVYMSASTT